MAEQRPLRQLLDFGPGLDGEYTVVFPRSVCYGVVVSGGFIMSAVHRAAVDFVSQNPQVANLSDVISLSLQYYRPTISAPRASTIQVRLTNSSRTATTLHFQLSQRKLCLSGYIVMAKFSPEAGISAGTARALVPPPLPASIRKMERNEDENWIGWLRPLDAPNTAVNGAASSYLKYFIPRKAESPHRADHWFTPGWKDGALPGGAVWTNELVHVVIDSGLPLWLDAPSRIAHHDWIVRTGLSQRGEAPGNAPVSNDFKVSHSAASLAMGTQFRKSLPPEGVKWLFMRATTLGTTDNRTDYNVILTDEGGDVLATSQHVVQVIPLETREGKL